MHQKNVQVYWGFFTLGEINDLSIWGVVTKFFDTSDGDMRFVGGNTMGHEKKPWILEEIFRPGVDLYFMSAP